MISPTIITPWTKSKPTAQLNISSSSFDLQSERLLYYSFDVHPYSGLYARRFNTVMAIPAIPDASLCCRNRSQLTSCLLNGFITGFALLHICSTSVPRSLSSTMDTIVNAFHAQCVFHSFVLSTAFIHHTLCGPYRQLFLFPQFAALGQCSKLEFMLATQPFPLAWVWYDYLITLEWEVHSVWLRKPSTISGLFICMRYSSLIFQTFCIVMDMVRLDAVHGITV